MIPLHCAKISLPELIWNLIWLANSSIFRNMSKYETNHQQLADAFKALSNPNRLEIFMQLLTCCQPGTVCSVEQMQSLCVSDLGDSLDIAPSTLSHHIKELGRAGLIRTQRRGQHVDCQVDTDTVQALGNFFSLPLAKSTRSGDRNDK